MESLSLCPFASFLTYSLLFYKPTSLSERFDSDASKQFFQSSLSNYVSSAIDQYIRKGKPKGALELFKIWYKESHKNLEFEVGNMSGAEEQEAAKAAFKQVHLLSMSLPFSYNRFSSLLL